MDVFSKMMFGHSDADQKPEEQTAAESKNEEDVDYQHVMNQLGSIMSSIDQLKPVFKDLGPMVSAIKKKIM